VIGIYGVSRQRKDLIVLTGWDCVYLFVETSSVFVILLVIDLESLLYNMLLQESYIPLWGHMASESRFWLLVT